MGDDPTGTFSPELDGDAFGRWWERLTEITGVQWEQVFPEGKAEMDATGFFVRLSLGRQVTGGTSVHARKTRYEPALELAVQNAELEMDRDEDGEPVVKLPGDTRGTGWSR